MPAGLVTLEQGGGTPAEPTVKGCVTGVKDRSKSERNRRVCLLRRSGFTYSQIAQMEGVSRPRVAQIVKEYNVEIGEDEGRAEIASALEFAEQKCVELINQPGWKMRPDGRPAEGPDGEPAPDNGIAIEALKTLVLVEDKRSRLFAWDKQVKRDHQQPHDEARQAMLAALAAERVRMEERRLGAAEREELEAYRRRSALPPPVRGEVVREPGPEQQRGEEGGG